MSSPTPWKLGAIPMGLCRMDAEFLGAFRDPAAQPRLFRSLSATILCCGAAYGFSFGAWRSPWQGVYSALKMPLLFFSVILASGLLNAMTAPLLRAGLSLREAYLAMLSSMAVTLLVMAACSPVFLFLAWTVPPPDPAVLGLDRADPAAAASMGVYRNLLLGHVAALAVGGLLGLFHSHRLVCALTRSAAVGRRLLGLWVAVMGFVGCELSWLFSPFLCEPVTAPHVVARLYAKTNFYEYVWRMLCDTLGHG